MMEDRIMKRAAATLISVIAESVNGVQFPSSIEEDRRITETAKCLLFGQSTPITGRENLQSIFNILNGNNGNKHYLPHSIEPNRSINYPTDEVAVCDYELLAKRLNDCLSKFELTDNGLNSVLEQMEEELTYIPGTMDDPDISLFDQAKLCAAIASCLPESVEDNIDNMVSDELFLLYSMDFSGIQDFIYTIASKGALKTLRAKSFYLEILMENIIDELLTELGLSRINLIYSGGGHCYLILPNTEGIIEIAENYNRQVNDWLLETFDISLYVGHGFAPCSGNSLRNVPEGSYVEIFRTVSRMISDRKANRYSAEQLIRINNRSKEDYSRECKVCHRIDKLNSENECTICSAIKNFSNNILNQSFFSIVRQDNRGLPLPGGMSIVADDAIGINSAVRVYRKRHVEDKSHHSIGLWVADYASQRTTLEEMASDAKDIGRIERIGVLRADVDNLGTAFGSGFKEVSGGNIMRTAALSRQLSLLFKCHINKILGDKNRNATICYSGGDDLFIVGEWYSVIELALDISNCFEQYTENTLTLSAGIGIYDSKYPISRIAYETAEMEDLSKHLDGKNAITFFEDNTYHWSEFEGEVLGDKFDVIAEYFDNSDSRGMSFLYKLFELIRNQNDRINFARYVYILSRLEPSRSAPDEVKDNYKSFSNHMYEWIKTEKDRRQLITAIMLYVYLIRNKEDKSNGISE